MSNYFSERMIDEVVRRGVLGIEFNSLLYEDANPAYQRPKKGQLEKDVSKMTSIERIWSVIERKQKDLQSRVFGKLSDGISDIVGEKVRSMGYENLRVPNTICRAGNAKLPPSVLVINMSSSLMRPSFYLGLCTIADCRCYAQQAENQHTNNVLPNRWQTDLMHTQMLQQYEKGNRSLMRDYFNLVETYIQLGNAYAARLSREAIADVEYRENRKLSKKERAAIRSVYNKYKITDVRLNETGDFHCQLAVDLWAKFAEKIKRKYAISTHAYTARNLDFSDASKVMAINASHSGINLGDEDERKFRAVPDDYYDSLRGGAEVRNRQPVLGYNGSVYYYKCPCGDNESMCDRCGVCFARNLTGKPYTIFVRYHGMKKANGLKRLFSRGEIEGVIEKLYKNGWVTDDEYKVYKSKRHQDFLSDLDNKINARRRADND